MEAELTQAMLVVKVVQRLLAHIVQQLVVVAPTQIGDIAVVTVA